MLYNPDKFIDTYYQICKFKNQYTGKYGTRKIIFNEIGDILKISEREYPKKKLEKFIDNNNQNKYKVYSTYNLTEIQYPSTNDIIQVQSNLLNSKHNEYGYMPL